MEVNAEGGNSFSRQPWFHHCVHSCLQAALVLAHNPAKTRVSSHTRVCSPTDPCPQLISHMHYARIGSCPSPATQEIPDC